MDPFNYNQIRRYLTLTFFLICFLLLCTQVFGAEKILQTNIKPIKPEEVNGQYCFIKVVIKQKGDEIIKEEIESISEQDVEQQAMKIGGSQIKRILEDPKLNKLAELAAARVEKLPTAGKAVVAAAFLGKMGLTADDLEKIKSQIPKIMDKTEEQ